MLVSGSILSSDISPKDAILYYDKSSIDFIHLDIMDGKFVKNKSYTLSDVSKFSKCTNKPFDVHLMVSDPLKYVEDLSVYNVSYITFHYEAVSNCMDVINAIKNNGIRVGISIKPDTSVNEIFPFLSYIDMVLIMGVEPGKSGQEFMEDVLDKIEVIRKKIDEENYNVVVSVDGGVNESVFVKIKEKGASMVVSSSYLLSGDIEKKLRFFRS